MICRTLRLFSDGPWQFVRIVDFLLPDSPIIQDMKNTTHSAIVPEGGQTYVHGDFHPGMAPEFYGNVGVN